MKRFYIIVLLSVLLFSCKNESPEENVFGTLELTSVQVESAKNETLSRAVDVNLVVEIWKDGSIYTDGSRTYRFEPGQFPHTVQLPVGTFVVKAFNLAYENKTALTNADKGEPLFFKEQSVNVVKDKICRLALSVPMINIGVSLALPAGFTNSFSHYDFLITQGKRTVTLKDQETAYFDVAAFTYALKVTNTDGEQKEMTLNHNKVQAGTVYNVTYSFASEAITVE